MTIKRRTKPGTGQGIRVDETAARQVSEQNPQEA